MKSRTSFSKLTVFKKDILRFAPVWALYLIGMMLVLFETGSYGSYDHFARNTMPDLVMSFGVVNIIYAAVCAAMLFGDLYNTRMCYSLHAMPQRRESWLLSHLSAGVLFSLVPNIVAALFLMLRLESYWFLALYWLLAVTLQFVFFFGVAVVSALLTGNRFAMLAVYAGFHFVVMLIYAVLAVIYVPMLPGVEINIADFTPFSPVVNLFRFDYFEFERYQVPSLYVPGDTMTRYRYLGLSTGWTYTAILGGFGLVAMALSLLLYQLRHLESAGDFVAFPKLKVPSCLIITLCVALCFALLGEAFGSTAIWMIVGVVVGFFGSLMLLERRIKVFRKKTFLGFGALLLTLILSFVAVQFDWFGIVRWTPEADRVQSVTIANYRNNSYDYDYGYGSNRISLTLREEEQIADIIGAHEDILDRMNEPQERTHYVVISYTLKSGRTVTRSYRAPMNGKNYEIFSGYFYTNEQLMGYRDWDRFVAGVQYMYYDNGEIVPELYAKIMEALKTSSEKGHVTLDYQKDYAYYLEYYVQEQGSSVTRTLYISKNATQLVELLESPEVIIGYADWDQYLSGVQTVRVNDIILTQESQEELLTALRDDCANGLWKPDRNCDYLVEIQWNSADGSDFYRQFVIDKDMTATWQWLQEKLNLDR